MHGIELSVFFGNCDHDQKLENKSWHIFPILKTNYDPTKPLLSLFEFSIHLKVQNMRSIVTKLV